MQYHKNTYKYSKIFPEKLSLMNIIEQHYLQNNNYTRHFFKVNTNDDISVQLQSKFLNRTTQQE